MLQPIQIIRLHRPSRKLATIAAMFAAVAVCLPVLGQNAPAGPQPDTSGLRNTRPRPGARHRLTDQESQEISQFMHDNSPNRWEAVESLPEDGPERRTIMVLVAARWRTLQTTREEDPGLYGLKIKQLLFEDDIYGLLGGTRSSAEREPLRDKVRSVVSQLVDLQFQERERRIARLRDLLKAEEVKLANERTEHKGIVDRRTANLIAQGSSAFRPDMPRPPQRLGKPSAGVETVPPATRPANP